MGDLLLTVVQVSAAVQGGVRHQQEPHLGAPTRTELPYRRTHGRNPATESRGPGPQSGRDPADGRDKAAVINSDKTL